MKVPIRKLLEFSDKGEHSLKIRVVSGEKGLDNVITTIFINRPGLNLFGFYEKFAFERVQIFGAGEAAFLDKLVKEKSFTNLEKFFSFKIPCCIFSHNYNVPDSIKNISEKKDIPILVSALDSTILINNIEYIFSYEVAPRTMIHGVMIEVFGIGVLITGESGVGKSECALELIERGHRLISDDVVDIRLLADDSLVGFGSKLIKHHMEIRGLGILNIAHLFGVGSIRDSKNIDIIINLEKWDEDKQYDRLGLDDETQSILDKKITKIDIPVRPGRNIPIIIETAAMNYRLKCMGYHSAKEFNKRVTSLIERGEELY
ncbi:HPr(Ser) kinase/phosphatase [Spirochaetota bacterium]